MRRSLCITAVPDVRPNAVTMTRISNGNIIYRYGLYVCTYYYYFFIKLQTMDNTKTTTDYHNFATSEVYVDVAFLILKKILRPGW